MNTSSSTSQVEAQTESCRRRSIPLISRSASDMPLKSALKSDWSPHEVSLPAQSIYPARPTDRRRSKSFPPASKDNHEEYKEPPRNAPSCSNTPAPAPSSPKCVHFPSQGNGALESIRIFRRHGRPVSISKPDLETDTETEGETSSSSTMRYEAFGGFMRNHDFLGQAARFVESKLPHRQPPFPSIALQNQPPSSLASPAPVLYELDAETSSPIPATPFHPASNVQLESLTFTYDSAPSSTPVLTGTVIVRNLVFEKHVSLRFTTDDWTTTSDISADYVESLTTLPTPLLHDKRVLTPGDYAAMLSAATTSDPWDRFKFTISLDVPPEALPSRIVWLAVRYSTAQGEWWDNNGGKNYKIAFRALKRDSTGVPRMGQVDEHSFPYSHPFHLPAFLRHLSSSTPTKTRSPASPPRLSAPPSFHSFEDVLPRVSFQPRCDPSACYAWSLSRPSYYLSSKGSSYLASRRTYRHSRQRDEPPLVHAIPA